MKKFLTVLSSIAFIAVLSLATVNAQEPEKKAEKAKTEKCSEKVSKDCPSTCDKKAKAEKTEKKQTEKKKK